MPCGNACTKSACATASARSSSGSPAVSGAPIRTFSPADAENSVGSSNAMATSVRSSCLGIAVMSRPSSVIRPSVASCSRGTSAVSVVLPLPVAPTRAIVSPGRMCRSMRSRTGGESAGASGYRNRTPSNSTPSGGSGTPTAPSARPAASSAPLSSSSAITSKYRAVAVAASWLIASRKPMESTGQRSASAVDRKATSVPADRVPSATRTVPRTSAAPIASSGRVTITAKIDASSRAFASSVPRSVPDSSRKARAWLRCRPKPLTMRMPSTLSSTTVVRSPTWSCARRATSEYRRSNIAHTIITGTAGPRITSPSAQSWASMMTTPTRIVTPLTSRNVSGKARNWRSSIRSVVPRDSSCPDAHRSWKATGSRWRCRYRSARSSASTCDSGRATSHRRSPNSSASATPSSSRYSAPSHTPRESRSATGPSTIHFRTSGITSPTHEATIATNAAVNSRTRTGRTYGHRRSRVRTAERSVERSVGVARVSDIRSDCTDRH